MNTRAAAIRLMARVLANNSRKLFDAFALPSVRGSDSITPTSTTASMPAISHSAGRNPTTCSRKPPMKKPAPLVAFFDPVNQATQRNNCPDALLSMIALIALFDAVLVRSLATPAMPCASTTQATDSDRAPGRLQRRQHAQAARSAAICPAISMRGMPKRDASQPPPSIGEDAGRLIQQEHERQDERRVAEAVEVQQHQHAQRAVGDGEQEIARW